MRSKRIGDRREFLSDVGRGMVIASVGAGLAGDLGFSSAFADEDAKKLSFGKREPLVELMQQTPVNKLQPLLVNMLKGGSADLRQLVIAGALANARTFGGEDYVGFHAMMALVPAFEMSRELPKARQALPVLKVLYRNTAQIQARGGRRNEVLRPVEPAKLAGDKPGGELLRNAVREQKMQQAEGIFATLANELPEEEAYNELLRIVQDDTFVHNVALAHRSWEMLDLIGREQAHTLLRQSVRFCIKEEGGRIKRGWPEPKIRTVLPKLLDQHRLVGRALGRRKADDAWVLKMNQTINKSTQEQAADAVAAALAEGMDPEAVGEAISLAANQLVLRSTSSRTHGNSLGVHGSDATNAWRNIARVTDQRNTVASLIVAAYHVAGQGQTVRAHDRGKKAQAGGEDPLARFRNKLQQKDPSALLRETEEAIRANNQALASAAILRYGEMGHPSRPVFDLMLRFAVSEDGRLHSEKYRTVTEEFAATRLAFRWRHLVALARVTASMYGYDRKDKHGHRAPGYEQACKLLGVG